MKKDKKLYELKDKKQLLPILSCKHIYGSKSIDRLLTIKKGNSEMITQLS